MDPGFSFNSRYCPLVKRRAPMLETQEPQRKERRMNTIRTIVISALMLGTGLAFAGNACAECHDVVVYRDKPSNDPHHAIGTAIGAVAGAVLLHGVGGGNGKALATVGGAVAGGAVGHHIAKENDRHRVRTVERQCT
jgi:outer membrane lipoprotein SlyB